MKSILSSAAAMITMIVITLLISGNYVKSTPLSSLATQGFVQSIPGRWEFTPGKWELTRDTKRDASRVVTGQKEMLTVESGEATNFTGNGGNSSTFKGIIYSPGPKAIITFTQVVPINSTVSQYRVYVGRPTANITTIEGTWYGTGGVSGEEGEFVLKQMSR